MVLDRVFVTARHKNKLLDSGGARFLERIVNQRLIDHGQHFLRHGLRRR